MYVLYINIHLRIIVYAFAVEQLCSTMPITTFSNSDLAPSPKPAQSMGKCYYYLIMFYARELLYIHTGTDTTQYEAVLNLLGDITRAIKVTPEVKETLSTKFMMKRWIQPTAACSEDDLAKLALEKVRQDPEQFPILVDMFRNTAGMEIFAERLEQIACIL